MKQVFRTQVFETNSSSMHSLIILSKEDFEKFKNKEIFFSSEIGWFKSYKDIPNLNEFKEECPYYSDLTDDGKKKAVAEFVENYFNTDYAVGYTFNGLDAEYKTVYDKDGNEEVALSIYIGEC